MNKLNKLKQELAELQGEKAVIEKIIADKKAASMPVKQNEAKLIALNAKIDSKQVRIDEIELDLIDNSFKKTYEYDEHGRITDVLDWVKASDDVIKALGIKKINGIITKENNEVLDNKELESFVSQSLRNSDPSIDTKIAKKVSTLIPNKEVKIDKEWIVVKNGKFNVKTGEFIKGEFDSINKIDWNYVPNAKSELGLEVLKRYEGTNAGFITQVFEATGLMMLQDRGQKFKVSIFANGNSNFGKSTLFEWLLQPVIGKKNIAAINFVGMDEQENAKLINKTCAYDSDMDKGQMDKKAIAHFKKVTGDSTLKAKVLYQDRFEFENYATCWVNCNGLPVIIDRGSGGSAENRIHVVQFTVPVKELYPDITLEDRLNQNRKEVSEFILANSLEALHEAYNRGSLTVTDESRKALAREITDEDTVVKFLGYYTPMMKAPMKVTDLFREYEKTFGGTDDNLGINYGFPSVKRNSFYATMRDNAKRFEYKIYMSSGYETIKLIPEDEKIDPYVNSPWGDKIRKSELQKYEEEQIKVVDSIEKQMKESY